MTPLITASYYDNTAAMVEKNGTICHTSERIALQSATCGGKGNIHKYCFIYDSLCRLLPTKVE